MGTSTSVKNRVSTCAKLLWLNFCMCLESPISVDLSLALVVGKVLCSLQCRYLTSKIMS